MSAVMVVADAPQLLAQPNPAPAPPPGLKEFGSNLISWLKWGVLVCGILGILFSAGMIIIGRRRGGEMTMQGFMGVGYGMVGLAIASVAATLVGAFSL